MDRAGVECGCGWEANGIRVRVSSAAGPADCGWEARRMGLGLGAGRGRGGLGYMGSRPGRSRGGQEGSWAAGLLACLRAVPCRPVGLGFGPSTACTPCRASQGPLTFGPGQAWAGPKERAPCRAHGLGLCAQI